MLQVFGYVGRNYREHREHLANSGDLFPMFPINHPHIRPDCEAFFSTRPPENGNTRKR